MPDKEDVVVGGATGGAGVGGLGAAIAAETHGALGEGEIQARGYWELVWIRFKRDKVAIASGIFLILLLLVAFVGAPIAKHFLGHTPNDTFEGLSRKVVNQDTGHLARPLTHFCYLGFDLHRHCSVLILGSNGNGQDEFLRLLYGAQASLEVAVFSTIGVMIIGVTLGATAGYFRGWVDTVISRVTEITMAFPFLLFIIALAATIGPRLSNITFGIFGKGVVSLIVIFTIFGWFYPARIMRAQTLSIREKEYVEAARMVGASDSRIIRSHVLPHLVAPMIVYSTLLVASYVLAEAGLSYLSLGIDPTTAASWGNMLADASNYFKSDFMLMIWPGLAVLLTTLAFNLMGDGLRDAFDPRAAQQH